MTEREKMEYSTSMEKQRSINLNNSYWAWLSEVARDMNNRGITLPDILEKMHHFEVCPTKDNLHDCLSKNYIQKQFQKTSSSQLTNQEMQQLIDALTLFFGTYFDNDIVFSPDMHNILKSYKE